jgi:hypothetical protein
MQQDQYRESRQYYPCPKKTLNTAQIDKQFFGGQGDLSSSDYSYKMIGGCSDFIASALISNSKANCFKIDQNRRISTITCPNEAPLTPLGSFATYNATKATEECNMANETAGGSKNDRARALVKAQERMEELNLTGMWSNDKLEEDMLRNKGIFAAVDQDGNPMAINDNNSVGGWNEHGYFAIGDCDSGADFKTLKNPDEYGSELWLDGREMNQNGSFTRELTDGSHKIVFVGGKLKEWLGASKQAKRKNMKYNFETGTWSNDRGEKFKNGKLVE